MNIIIVIVVFGLTAPVIAIIFSAMRNRILKSVIKNRRIVAPPSPDSIFTPDELNAINRLLKDRQKIPNPKSEGDSPMSRKEHLTHSLFQVRRFARTLQTPDADIEDMFVRFAQLSMNYGRSQELVGSIGGRRVWWKPFEEICEARDWVALEMYVFDIASALNVNIGGRIIDGRDIGELSTRK